MENQKWKSERRKGIGGSDIGAILGIDKNKTAVDVYLSKINKVESEDNDFMMMGRLLEPVIAQRFEYETGFKTIKPDPMIIEDTTNPIFKASPDFYYANQDGEQCVLECKSSFRTIDEPDPHYWTQVQWYLGITGAQIGTLAYLIGAYTFKMFTVERDDELIEYLRSEAQKFWNNHVKVKNPPSPTNSVDVAKIFEKTKGKAKNATPEVYDIYKQLLEVKEKMGALSDFKETLEFQLKNYMQDHEVLEFHGDQLVTWKTSKSRRIDTKKLRAVNPEIYYEFSKETESRRFLVK